MGMSGKTIFLLFFFLSETSFVIAVGKPRLHKVIKRLKVGRTNIYRLMPSVLIVLVRAILIIMPSILVINPPIINIIVDLINLFFIVKYMKIRNKILYCYSIE